MAADVGGTSAARGRLSSDPTRSPKQLSTLDDLLRTRFEWRSLAHIQPPDPQVWIAILQKGGRASWLGT